MNVMWNINRLLRLGIRGKLAFAFAGLSVLPILIVGIYGITIQSSALRAHTLENLAHGVGTVREKAASYLTDVASDMQFLALRLKDMHMAPNGAIDDRAMRDIQREFQYFITQKPAYRSIHYYSESGEELLRIDVRHGRAHIATPQELGPGARYYREVGSALNTDQIDFLPMEITRVDAGDSLLPALTGVLRLGEGDFAGGELVLVIAADEFFRRVEATVTEPSGSVMIADREGHYLYNSELKHDWNKLLATRDDANVPHDFPARIAASILNGETGTAAEGIDSIVSYAPLVDPAAGQWRLAVIESVPSRAVFASIHSLERAFAAFILVFLSASLGLSYIATQQFIQPIRTLREGAEEIARGGFNKRISIATYDEIEHLADQFNRMAASLEEHENELTQHREHLEQMVAARTAELQREKDKLERAHELIVRAEKLGTTGEMSAVLAHEIRNSLTSVKMILQMQHERAAITADDAEALDVALRSVARMEGIVSDLLQFTRPAAPARRRIDLNAALESSVALALHQMVRAGARVDVALAPNLPAVLGDTDRLQELFVNLLLNAAQSLTGGGTVRVSSAVGIMAETREDLYRFPGDISPANEPEDRHTVITAGTRVVRAAIADTGRGIPPDRLTRIFDPFFTTRVNGTGLGLPLVKRIASEHGAIVEVESTVGAGSTFTLIIPVPEDLV